MSSHKTVLIIGAGLGGLTLAIGLLQQGFKVRVHEQAPVLRELGAGLTMQATAMQVFDALGMTEKVRKITNRVASMTFVDFKTADVLHGEPDYDWAGKPTSVEQTGHAYRARLHALLVDEVAALDPQAVILDHRLEGFSQTSDGVRVTFANGDVDTGDLLVACDGVRSSTFRHIFGEDNPATFAHAFAIRFMLPRSPAVEPFLTGGRAVNFIGFGRHMLRYGVDDGALINCVGIARTDSWREEGWSNPSSREELHEYFGDFHADVLGLIDHAPIDGTFKWALYDREPLTNWTVGRATLLGDAAHPMLPYLGQGAAAAIEDGFILSRALTAHENHQDAFAAYQEERIRRTTQQMRAANAHAASLDQGPERYMATRGGRDTTIYDYKPVAVKI